jgi:hypothetical protein
MWRIAGDHADRPYDAMSTMDRIAKNDLPPTEHGHIHIVAAQRLNRSPPFDELRTWLRYGCGLSRVLSVFSYMFQSDKDSL